MKLTPLLKKMLKNLTDVLVMGLKILGGNQDVIQIDRHKKVQDIL